MTTIDNPPDPMASAGHALRHMSEWVWHTLAPILDGADVVSVALLPIAWQSRDGALRAPAYVNIHLGVMADAERVATTLGLTLTREYLPDAEDRYHQRWWDGRRNGHGVQLVGAVQVPSEQVDPDQPEQVDA